MTKSIVELLTFADENDASDLHVTVGVPPYYRINGLLQQHGEEILTPEDLKQMICDVLPPQRMEEFETNGEVDFNYSLPGRCRFRMNAYHQRNSYTLAARKITVQIPTFEQLGMPGVLKELCQKTQGLILVTGPTGSGKSTTLAAMIDYINENQSKHIITLEDPIEYLHKHKRSIVNQREIGSDTKSFANGLRAALRQDPDIILVGEMRDLETISTAITAAETGHLVMATLHTSSALTTIDRIIDVFPPHQQGQIRIQLANVLQGIISQRLFKRIDKPGRIAATEVLVHTSSVANLIRNGKVQQLTNIMQMNRKLGMHTIDSSIQHLLSKRMIDFETAKVFMNAGEFA